MSEKVVKAICIESFKGGELSIVEGRLANRRKIERAKIHGNETKIFWILNKQPLD
jgi:hypothetical protein